MPITMTQKAAEEFQSLLNQEGKAGASLRLWIAGLGCHGFRYGMGIEDKDPDQGDQAFESNGIRVIVDSESMKFLDGSKVDYVSDPDNSGFSIDNPNPAPKADCDCSSGSCGSADAEA